MPDSKPPKPYDTFPLFAHARGYWCKTIDRKHVSFGPWAWPDREDYERSWRAALDRYHRHQEDVAHGRIVHADRDQMTVGVLVDAYLRYQHGRATGSNPKILASSYADIRRVVHEFRDFVGAAVTVQVLEVFNPMSPGASLVGQYIDHANDRFGWHAFNKRMVIISGLWSWAEHPIRGVLAQPFRLKSLFAKREEKFKRHEKRARQEDRGKQRWTPDELRAFFQFSPMPLRAMLGLMYFAAFGNSDCADVPQSAIDFKPANELGLPDGWGVEYFARPKTGFERAAVLPKFVMEDLHAAIDSRPDPADPIWNNRIFLTAFGKPFVRDIVHQVADRPGEIDHTVNIDSLAAEFRKLRDSLGRCPEHGWASSIQRRGPGFRADLKGLPLVPRRPMPPESCPTCKGPMAPMRRLGAYTFRHTAITYASGATDQDAIHLFEGHAIPGVRKEYVEEIEVHKLLAIAQRLEAKLGPIEFPLQNSSEHQAEAKVQQSDSCGAGAD